jgi:hypothetical protein
VQKLADRDVPGPMLAAVIDSMLRGDGSGPSEGATTTSSAAAALGVEASSSGSHPMQSAEEDEPPGYDFKQP